MSERADILENFQEAVRNGARGRIAADAIGISLRTVQRWQRDLRPDGRISNRFVQSNALSAKERQTVIETANSPEFRDLSPVQIVPILAEQGRYIASESTFYRVLHAAGLQRHR
ncbi:MAG: IS3 family transposase, partial [Candidatus Paceibacterota bacterium]